MIAGCVCGVCGHWLMFWCIERAMLCSPRSIPFFCSAIPDAMTGGSEAGCAGRGNGGIIAVS